MTAKDFILNNRHRFIAGNPSDYIRILMVEDSDIVINHKSKDEITISGMTWKRGDEEFDAARYLICLYDYFKMFGMKITSAPALLLLLNVKCPFHCRAFAQITSYLTDEKTIDLPTLLNIYPTGFPDEEIMREWWIKLKEEDML